MMRAALLVQRSVRPGALVPVLQPRAGMSTATKLQRTKTIKLKDLQNRTKEGKRVTRLEGPFEFDYGGSLPHVDVAWEQWGDPSLPASRTVYILPSFSNSSHVVRSLNDPSPGWWEGMVGPGLYIDTNHFRVISASNLGGPFGTTSPVSEDPRTGQPYRLSFPQITPNDVARVHHRLMQELGLQKLHAVIGCSMGGMTGIALASMFPDAVSRLAVTACTAKTTPGTAARRRVQRRAILADPLFMDGEYGAQDYEWPVAGMRVAREIGMICYRSREEFDQRFEWGISKEAAEALGSSRSIMTGPMLEVEKYMEYMGQKFAVARYDPCCYLLQSRSMDLMDVGFGSSFSDGVLRIKAEKVFACGIKQDELIPSHELEQFAELLKSGRTDAGSVVYDEMSSLYGHDAFFKELSWLGPRLKSLVESGLEAELAAEARMRPMLAI